MSNTVEYIFRLKNDISAAAGQASQSARSASQDVRQLNSDMDQTADTGDAMRQTLDGVRVDARRAADEVSVAGDAMQQLQRQSQQLDMMTQLTALMGMREGVSAITGGLIGLGVVAGEDAEQLNKINAAFSLMAGAVTTLKTLQAVQMTLNTAEASGAVITAFRAAVSNPLGIAMVGAGLGAAAGVAGALLLSNSTTNNSNVNVTIQDTTPQEAVSDVYQVVTGGAL